MKQRPATKQKILDSAQYLFARDGFQATSLRDITRRASVNIASINYHFGSKEALLATEILSSIYIKILLSQSKKGN